MKNLKFNYIGATPFLPLVDDDKIDELYVCKNIFPSRHVLFKFITPNGDVFEEVI